MRKYQILTSDNNWHFATGNSQLNKNGYAIIKKDDIEVFRVKLCDIVSFRC